jgi:iron complex outermembrane receptor protein
MNGFGARNTKKHGLLVGASVLVLAAGGQAFAQDSKPDDATVAEVVVTGTRIVSSVNAISPTPVMAVSAEQLAQTTPSNIPEGLNKLPVFQGSTQPRRPGGGGGGSIAQNVLNLRGFGTQRTLVLVDGHRVAPTNPEGTTDIDTIPQMLISRIDVTTGGASAVYGSDAVTGVVNFVLDKNFTGLKFETNAGISKYGDGGSGKVGLAAGRAILGGKGHLSGSVEYRHQDSVPIIARPDGAKVYVRTGNGSAALPYTVTPNARLATSTYGGRVTNCVGTCPGNGMNFASDGVLSVFVPGTTTGTTGTNQGGDGAYSIYSDAIVKSDNGAAFGRFSYDFDNGVNFYIQGSFAQAETEGRHFPLKLTPGTGQASTFYKNNPFLSAATRTLLGDNGQSNSTNTFQLGQYITSQGANGFTGTRNLNIYEQVQTGLNGDLGAYHWDLFYTHGKNRLKVDVVNNQNYQKLFAALDAVTGPGGTVQCYAATQAATASAYAGCVPLSPFGPTAMTANAYDWFAETTSWNVDSTLDNLGGSFAGSLFNTWAGPIDFAVSAESRWNTYQVRSGIDPTQTVNCTGLRICNPALQLWAQPVTGSVKKTSNVWEIAGELSIPLVKDAPLIQALNANLAGRYTDYSVSGAVQTWKAGLDWSVNDTLRLRGTVSRDIRAPTLDDLYRPLQPAVQAFNDLHTKTNSTVFNYTQGNPNLKPEVARAYTAGAVFTPSGLLPGFTASLDWYKITLENAISQIQGSNTNIQLLCEASNGTSPYCSLYQRPLPFSDTSPLNYPTKIFTQNLNSAYTRIEGVDFEANYRFNALGGGWTVRLFANHQPTNESVNFPASALNAASPLSVVAAPKNRVTTFLRYQLNDWSFGIQDRWLGGYSQVTSAGQNYLNPNINSYQSVDLNVDWKTRVWGSDTTLYLTVENLFNKSGPLIGGTNVGGVQPVPAGYDVMGRYFTVGLKSKF